MHNIEVVTDQLEKAAAKVQMDQSGTQQLTSEQSSYFYYQQVVWSRNIT